MTTEQERTVVNFDHHSPDLTAAVEELGAGPVLRAMHERCPVAWTDEHEGYWVLTGYEEIKRVATDSKTFSSDNDIEGRRGGKGFTGVTLPARHVGRLGFVEMDDPEHGQLRRPMIPWLGPDAVALMRPVIEDLATAFVDEVIERGSCDFVEEISSPVPAVFTMILLGMPCADWKTWSDGNHLSQSSPPGSEQQLQGVELMASMTAEVSAKIESILENPPNRPPENLLEMLCLHEFGGRRLTHAEIVDNVVLVIAGGVDTTTSATAMAVNWLANHPAEREVLRENPDLMPTAVEELLRVMGPVTANARTATCPVTVGGQRIEAGERLLMMWAAGNHDGRFFENPEQIDLSRKPNAHLSFGMGSHRCIGLHVGRATMTILLDEVLLRIPDFTVDSAHVKIYPDVGQNQGWINLPLTFTPGERVGSQFDPQNPGNGGELASKALRELAAMTQKPRGKAMKGSR
jgi:cytochrome P450